MDVADFIKRNGKKEIQNPLYNPKSKKNKVPRTITVLDLGQDNDAIINMATHDARNQYSINSEEAEKYRKAGLNWNPWENLDKQLADSQGALTKLGNSLAQAVVSEFALGTVKGVSDLVDFIIGGAFRSNNDYSNPVSQKLEEWQEQFRNFAAIHTDPSLNIGNGGLTDVGWWASNIPSVVSSLTLLIPSTGVVKGLSFLGKGLKVGAYTRKGVRAITGVNKKLQTARTMRANGMTSDAIQNATKLTDFQRIANSTNTARGVSLFLENGTTAALMRTMENYQEARQTYNEMYDEASENLSKMNDDEYNSFIEANAFMLNENNIDVTNRDEVAKYVASKAADRTFAMDWTNVAFDVIQMYGLRNAWKGIKNASSNPAKVRRAQKDAMKFGSAAEAKAAKAKWSIWERAGEKLEDFAYGAKNLLFSQATEGIEEAVNTIASKEGIHYGKTLLGTESKTSTDDDNAITALLNGLNGRLGSYLANPELWDAAFWGVMGGIVFQAGGSKLNRIKNKITDKSEATDEAKKQRSWWQLDELPENKRRIAEIWDRRNQFNEYKTKLDQINDGKNIFDLDEDGKPKPFFSEQEQQIARDKLMKAYITKMTLRAAHSGNLNMFKEFLADESVRASFIDQGFFDKGNENKTTAEKDIESKEFIKNILNQVEQVEKEYTDELIAVTDAASLIKRNNTPVEYLEIIASENIYNRQLIEDFDKQKIAIEERISELTTALKDKTDKDGNFIYDLNVDYRNQIKLQVLTNELGHLRAQRKRLASEKDKSLSVQFTIENIDKKINEIEHQLDNAELAYATFQSLRYWMDVDGRVQSGYNQEADAEAFAYMDKMITQNTEDSNLEGKFNNELDSIFGLTKKSKKYISQADKGRFEVMLANTSAINNLRNAEINVSTIDNLSTADIDKLKNAGPELHDLMKTSVSLDIQKAWTNADIYRTVDEVEDRVNAIHNSIDKARITAINEANNKIQKLYKKYGQNIRNIVYDIYNNTPDKNGDTSVLTEAELQELKDAMDILALQKSYNKHLINKIEEIFDRQDDIDASNEEETTNEESENSSTFENEISAVENNEPTISSTEQSETITNSQNGQINDINQQIEPQNIQNRQPSFYANFYNNSRGFESNKHSNVDNNHQVAVYDNEDGTFTIVPKNDKDLHNKNFFGNIDKIDTLAPYKPVTYPIARKNKRGKLEIVEKGELTNDIYEEVTPESTIDDSINSQIEQDETVDETLDTSLPPTGEVVDEVKPETDNEIIEEIPIKTPVVENVNLVIDQSNEEDDIRNKSLAKFIKAYKDNKDVNFDDLAKNIINEEIKNGKDKSIVESAVNKAKAVIQRKIESRLEAKNTMLSSIDEVVIAQSSLIEENVPVDAITAYHKAVQDMLNQYAKEMNLNRIGGKLYINLEDLLRYINIVASDNTTANMIYSSLREYLNTKEAQKEFIIIDDENISKKEFFKNINKSQEQRNQERLDDNAIHRVQIDSLDDYTAFDELQQGDKLTASYRTNRIELLDNKGRIVGILPYSTINKSTGAYEMVNDGWVYDILTNNNNEIVSRLKDRFVKWLSSSDKFSTEINEIIYELAYTKTSEERKQELLDKFNNNPEIKKAKQDGLISNNASNKKLINGLVKLWRFENRLRLSTLEEQNDIIAESVNIWFRKLRDSYDNVSSLASGNNDIEIIVNDVNNGELIRIVENDKLEAEKQALPVNEAIAGQVNPNIHKIAITDKRSGMLKISGSESFYLPSETAGVTMVVIPDRSGNPGFVQAFPAIISENYIGNDVKEITKAIKNEINTLIKNYNENPSSKTYNELKDFFRNLFNDKNGYSSLFNNVIFAENNNRFTITSAINHKNFIAIYEKSNRSNFFSRGAQVGNSEFEPNSKNQQTQFIEFTNDELINYIEEIINNASIKFDFIHITSDDYNNFNLRGVTSKQNGKFRIHIGDRTWEYNSFNEFILNNNLVRLNTKPNENGTSNYSRKGSRTQRANQTLNIRIVSKTSSPVEETVAPEVDIPIRGKSINEQVVDILNSDSKTKGLDIIRSLIGSNSSFTEDTLKMFEHLGILPNNIIFDADFNNKQGYEDKNAAYNRRTGDITIGQKWLNMFNNPVTRPEAIRKLIHEQLHAILTENKGYIESAKKIYEEYKNFVTTNFDKNHPTRKYLFENYNEDNALEEFLVESLTSKELASYLNQIDADVTKKRGRRNLLQKILEFMAKVFNWNVRKGSLYEKELHTLRNVFNKNNQNKTNITSKTKITIETKQDETNENVEETEEIIEENVNTNVEETDTSIDDVMNVLDDDLFSTINETINEQILPFENSKVVDDNGKPIKVYHRSRVRIDKFDENKLSKFNAENRSYGFHFGTRQAANEVELNSNSSIVHEVYLNIQNPYIVEDSIQADYNQMIRRLLQDSIISNEEFSKARNYETSSERHNFIKKALNKKGYDGIQYINEIEDKGSTSWIVFDDSKIRQISINDESILYSSINEDTPINIASNVPNISSFSQRLSVAEQTEFDDLVASALFMTSCR